MNCKTGDVLFVSAGMEHRFENFSNDFATWMIFYGEIELKLIRILTMGFIIYGVQQANIGIDEFLIKCPSCETDSFADVMIQSNYYHIYFIPIVPFEKEANLICQKCGLKRYNVPFISKFFKNYHEIKSKFKHPLYTYSLVLFIAILILISIVIAIIN